MKFTTLLLSSLALAQASIAAPIGCTGGNFHLFTDDGQKTAQVYEGGQPVEFGNLHCQAYPGKLACTSTGVADAGFYALIQIDKHNAVLSTESIAGPRKITDMVCAFAENAEE